MRGFGIGLFLLLAAAAPEPPVPVPPTPPRAGGTWAAQTSGTTTVAFNGLSFVNSLEGFAAGSGGAIHRTLDGGATAWAAQTSGTTSGLNAVSMNTADIGLAAGDAGVIVRTANGSAGGGSTWTPGLTTGDQLAIASSGTTNVWTAGVGGLMRTTTTGGISWLAGSSGLTTDIRALSFPTGNEGYAVGVGGKVQRTLDGLTWTAPSAGGTVGTAQQMNGVAMAPGTMNPTTVGWAVGNNGIIRKTSNAGVNWAPNTSGTTQVLNAAAAGDANNAWAVGNVGTIVATSNGGATAWTAQTSNASGSDLFGVSFVNSGTWNGIAVGAAGRVVWTSTGGATWTAGSSGVGSPLRSVSVVGPTLAVAVGDAGVILKSIDGGATWTQKGVNVTAENLTGVTMASATNGWASGSSATILTTADGGDTWTAQISGVAVAASLSLKDVKFADATRAVAVGTSGLVLKSVDGGVQWTRRLNAGANITVNTLNGVAFSSATRGWAVGDAGVMFLTNDAGDTWTSFTAVTPNPLYGIAALSDSLFVAVGGDGTNGTAVVISFDGTSWTETASSVAGAVNLRAVSFPAYSRRGYAVSDTGSAYVTVDAGTSWTPEATGLATALRGVAFPSQTQGWAAGDGGSIVRRDGSAAPLVFPPHIGTPYTYQPPLIDGFINPEHDSDPRRPDTGWDHATQVAYANGTTQPPVTFQGLRHNAGGSIFLSFEARVDDAWDDDDAVVILFRSDNISPRQEHAANDRKIVIYPVTTGTGGTSGGILAPGYVAPPYTNHENCDPRLVKVFAWNAGSGWTPVALSPELKIKVRSWSPPSGGVSWSVETQVPTTNAVWSQWINLPTTGQFLFSYYVLQKKIAGVLEASWPRDLVLSGPSDIETAPMPASDWGTASIDPAATVTGVRIKVPFYQNIGANTSGGIGPLTHEIHGMGTNTFVANVQNDDTTPTAPVSATFRIANWGVNGGDPSSGAWTLVPVTSGSNPPTAAPIPGFSGGIPGEAQFTFDWALSTTEKAAYAPPHEHQCMQVSLDSTGNVNFVERSAWVNMDYVASSVFSRPAHISAKGFGAHGAKGGVQRFYLHVTTHRFDYDPARDSLQTVPPPNPKTDKQSDRKEDHPYYSGENLQKVRLKQFYPNLVAEKGPVAHYVMETHGYRETTNTVKINGHAYPILEQVNGFGYVARHGSSVADWTSGLSGAVVKKLGPYTYEVDVPINGSRQIDSGLESKDGGPTGTCGLVTLIALIFLFLLIIFWFLKRNP